jgi:protein-L-isoaspartate(D-aspartate) O-methyltransferase
VIASDVMKLADFFSRNVTEAVMHAGTIEPGTGDNDAAESAQRCEMVERQIRARGIQSQRVLDAMASVPRHLFVPAAHVADAYADSPLSIGAGQTISQPYMVAAMADALSLEGCEKVLEVGGGSGYQAAVLSLLAREVIAVESQPALAEAARERLALLGYGNVRIEMGDGSLGWPLHSSGDAPYDAILVTTGAPAVPPPLIEQLAEGGRLVIPVGAADQQELVRVVKRHGRVTQESLLACRFVPLLGRYGWHPSAHTQEPSRG